MFFCGSWDHAHTVHTIGGTDFDLQKKLKDQKEQSREALDKFILDNETKRQLKLIDLNKDINKILIGN